MAARMTAALVCDALTMALWRRKRPEGVIVHSDRGSQYCSASGQRRPQPPSAHRTVRTGPYTAPHARLIH